MATLRIEIPDGRYCEGCSFLLHADPRGGDRTKCKLFDCHLGNKLTDIFKCPMCLEQTKETGIYRDGHA